jgi:hypothetical protein
VIQRDLGDGTYAGYDEEQYPPVRGALRSCAVHGRSFWLAYGSRSFGGRFFCPGYLRDDLFKAFDPQPYRRPVPGEPEGDHTVRLIDGGWPTPDTPQVVLARLTRDGRDVLMVRPLGMPQTPAREVALDQCWPHRYVPPSRNRCWS